MALQSERSSLNLPCGSEAKMTSSQSLYTVSDTVYMADNFCGITVIFVVDLAVIKILSYQRELFNVGVWLKDRGSIDAR